MPYKFLPLIACLFPLYAHAETAAPRTWDVGLAVTANQSPFVDGDTVISARPVKLNNSGFDIPGITWSFSKAPQREFYVGAGLDEWDHERGDSQTLSDMRKLDRAVNVRVGGAWKLPSGVANVDVAQDVANAHKGTQAKLRYTHNPEPHQASVRPYVEAQWLSSQLTDYYVGVDAAEVKAGRPAYQAGSAVALKTGLTLRKALTPKLTLVGGVDATHYGSAITDSPLVERSTVWGTYAGMTYRW